ncbi:hypothetical protein J6590_099069 [Homalodisca vitripennis]|nr:hypothetical protein J6590_099069 [Homalodisca vitripennis]
MKLPKTFRLGVYRRRRRRCSRNVIQPLHAFYQVHGQESLSLNYLHNGKRIERVLENHFDDLVFSGVKK